MHGKALGWTDSRTRSVEGEFADGNAHAVCPEVTQAQDALSVGQADGLDILFGPGLEHLANVAEVPEGDVEPPGAVTVDLVPLHARLADGGSVDEGHALKRVIDKSSKE